MPKVGDRATCVRCHRQIEWEDDGEGSRFWRSEESGSWCVDEGSHEPPAPQPLDAINVVFDGPPSHESGRFVEVEDDEGRSIGVGEWIERDDGLWSLRIAHGSWPVKS